MRAEERRRYEETKALEAQRYRDRQMTEAFGVETRGLEKGTAASIPRYAQRLSELRGEKLQGSLTPTVIEPAFEGAPVSPGEIQVGVDEETGLPIMAPDPLGQTTQYTVQPTNPYAAAMFAAHGEREAQRQEDIQRAMAMAVGKGLYQSDMPALGTEAIVEGVYPPTPDDIRAEMARREQHQKDIEKIRARRRRGSGARPPQMSKAAWDELALDGGPQARAAMKAGLARSPYREMARLDDKAQDAFIDAQILARRAKEAGKGQARAAQRVAVQTGSKLKQIARDRFKEIAAMKKQRKAKKNRTYREQEEQRINEKYDLLQEQAIRDFDAAASALDPEYNRQRLMEGVESSVVDPGAAPAPAAPIDPPTASPPPTSQPTGPIKSGMAGGSGGMGGGRTAWTPAIHKNLLNSKTDAEFDSKLQRLADRGYLLPDSLLQKAPLNSRKRILNRLQKELMGAR